jgi:nitrogen regulatory protein PII
MSTHSFVIAYVRRARRSAVIHALRRLGFDSWTESDVTGYGHAANGHGVEHSRFEIVVSSTMAPDCVKAISRAAHTGNAGDGLVVTLPILELERMTAPASTPTLRIAP